MKLRILALPLFFTSLATANDLMYPPAPAAQKAISIDGQGFIINGERTYIASGSLHYARVPHELWRDRLLRMKRAGFNTVQTYAFWNFHEPRENEWNFTGDADLGAFLDTAKELGMYATVRVGPYVCAEWDSGGYPIWLKFKPPMKVRTADPEFLKWNDHWYDKILPIVAAHQIHKGGNVIMVQLENEHPKGWGTIDGNPYFDHLHKKAIELGIEVPFFFSGLNHGFGPAPSNVAGRTTPWYTTEFWPGWFDVYGNISPKRFREVERDNWRILANGGAGHNFYMLHGGTNFDTWNDDSGAASYDYGAAIGQAGDLRPVYYRMKRANLFAKDLVELRRRRANIDFDWNSAKTIESGMTGNYFSNARLLDVVDRDNVHTNVCYGPAGKTGKVRIYKELSVDFPNNAPHEQDIEVVRATVSGAEVGPRPSVTVDQHDVKPHNEIFRVVSMDDSLADRTWVVEKYVICGPAYVGDFSDAGGKISMTIERPYGQPSCGKVIVYGSKVQQFAVKADTSLDTAPAPQLENWQMRLSPEAAAAYDDSFWKSSNDPQQMGADGDTSAFAWYRATVMLPAASHGTLNFTGKDNIEVFVNGQRYDDKTQFRAGQNTIAVLTSHHGRQKAFNYLGTLHNYYRKGLFGPVLLDSGGTKTEIRGWKLRGGVGPTLWPSNKDVVSSMNGRKLPDSVGGVEGGWKPVATTAGVPVFYFANFKTTNVPGRILRLVTQGMSRGTAWFNGHNLGRYPEKIKVPGMYLPECWLKDGENELVVFDEEGAAPTPLKLEVEKAASREVIPVSEPCDPSTPLVVPKDDEPTPPQMNPATADNVAWKKPAAASSSEQGHPPESANDGDFDTRWCAAGGSTPQWWRVDLEKPYDLTGCEIGWESDGTRYQYLVEGSADSKSWTMLSDQRKTKNTAQIQKLAFHAAGIRYFRITVTGLPKHSTTPVWSSICEVKVTAAAK